MSRWNLKLDYRLFLKHFDSKRKLQLQSMSYWNGTLFTTIECESARAAME